MFNAMLFLSLCDNISILAEEITHVVKYIHHLKSKTSLHFNQTMFITCFIY